jgi:hypothetical protein
MGWRDQIGCRETSEAIVIIQVKDWVGPVPRSRKICGSQELGVMEGDAPGSVWHLG